MHFTNYNLDKFHQLLVFLTVTVSDAEIKIKIKIPFKILKQSDVDESLRVSCYWSAVNGTQIRKMLILSKQY